MCPKPASWSWRMGMDKASAGGMRQVWNGHGGGSRVTMAAHGRRWAKRADALAHVVAAIDQGADAERSSSSGW